MKFTHLFTFSAAGLAMTTAITLAVLGNNAGAEATPPESTDEALYQQGEYIVHKLGLCIDCHSPRGERGAFIEGRHLTGAPLGFTPTVPMPAWAPAAPPIAGLPPTWSKEDMVKYLMSGTRPHNLPPTMPPMPEYRMNEADAKAVAHYLQAIGPAAPAAK